MLLQNVDAMKSVQAIFDTGSRQAIMTLSRSQKAGILRLLLPLQPRIMPLLLVSALLLLPAEVVLGYIVLNLVDLRMGSEEATMSGPRIAVLQQPSAESSTSTQTVDLILGMDFLQQHQGIIDLRQQELHLINAQGEDVMVPFLQPRATLPLSFDESEAQEEVTKDDGCRNTNTCGSSD
jgi:hypothetical protein